MHTTRTTRRLLALLFAVGLLVAACGGDDGDQAAPTDDAPAAAAATDDEMSDDEMTADTDDEMADDEMSEDEMTGSEGEPFGDACAAVPASGEGSFGGMADDPVATAASNNPELSTLVGAVSAAGLVDTLNTGGPWTVFAPANAAFAAIPADDLEAVLADTDLLTSILTFHVLDERLAPDDLAGTHTTVNGADLTVEGSGESFTVEGANVVCGNVQTANATVYIIDAVLMP